MSLLNAQNVVHVEVCLNHSLKRLEAVESLLKPAITDFLAKQRPPINTIINIDLDVMNNKETYRELELVQTLLLECDAKRIGEPLHACDLQHLTFYFYYTYRRDVELEMFEADGADGDAVPASNHWLLPSSSFIDLWENLIYENGLKEKLLKFALSALTFSQHCVNQNIISCNRLILLHGPPGTGKTSLCKGLAQKLAIRTRRTFPQTHLIEINSHSLFSKWFSESGKLVMRLFARIREIIDNPHNLVCVLIDEVESLAYARDCMSAQEPKDAMRVVNALLTQLDGIKEYPNVLILATSNLADSIDLAFLERADIKQYIGLPSAAAIRRIYESMLVEMMRVKILRSEPLTADDSHEGLLSALSERSIGLSGRTLRKLPFLAHAVYMSNLQFGLDDKISLSDFLDAMLAALERHQYDQELMKK